MNEKNPEIELNAIVSELLVDYPLYRKINIPEKLQSPWEWNNIKIKSYCENDSTEQTFGVKLPKELENYYSRQPGNKIVYPNDHFDKDENLNFALHIRGKCSYCNKFRIDFMVNIFKEKKEGELFARKIGAFPPKEIKPEKDILSYLLPEHQEYYKKALMNLSQGYGIGAFAYFRRITEDIIKKVIKDVINLELEGNEKVKKAWEDYQKNHVMSSLLDSINPYLPNAILDIGDNPLRLLYETASLGIHELNEDECLDKAQLIDVLLQFVISKMNEEKSTVKKVREAIKKLRK